MGRRVKSIVALLMVLALLYWQGQSIEWYMVFACMIAACIVALVAMSGWEKVSEIWQRTAYKNKE